MTRLLIPILAILLGGCATRGTLDFDCPRFDTAINGQRPFRTVLRPTKLESTIRGERITPEQEAAADEARAAEIERLGYQTRPEERRVALLLSGGGQWGAFGAGFLSRLLQDGRPPRTVHLVTGVSTGALQALFVGAGLAERVPDEIAGRNWAGRGVTAHEPPNYADLMQYEYRPNRENEIANRNAQMMSIVTGSMAGLQPLRAVIENALCRNPDGEEGCMIDRLAESRTVTLIGFVDAEDGNFYYVDVNRIARSTARYRRAHPDAPPDIDPLISRRQAQQCITAAALASVAMPAFFQQVRVNRRTYYDGGVRRSVFADYAVQIAGTASAPAAQGAAAGAPPAKPQVPSPIIYVLRNGPTSLRVDEEANDVRIVVDSALRAEQVVVNELEVGSVAGLRLEQPYGPMHFRSADSWEQFMYHDDALGSRTCRQRKGDGVMFDPDFMRCIMAYGYLVAGEPSTDQVGEPIWDEPAHEEDPAHRLYGWRQLPPLRGQSTGAETQSTPPPSK